MGNLASKQFTLLTTPQSFASVKVISSTQELKFNAITAFTGMTLIVKASRDL